MNHFDEFRKRVEGGPRIQYKKADGTWNEVYGHGCETQEAAEAYCKHFGDSFRTRPVDKPSEPEPLIKGDLL